MKKIKKDKRKKLLVLSAISTFAVLGGTLAYFTTSTTIANMFSSAKYETKIVENFESPDNWTPGTTTQKEISVTNNGSIDMALRATYSERWTNANGVELPLSDSNNNIASIINFNSDWIKNDDGYYYYGSKENMTRLQPKNTSTSFINSVTFNEKINATLNKEVSSDGKTITYTSNGNGYDNAKYSLTVKIDTIQYDQASNFWR